MWPPLSSLKHKALTRTHANTHAHTYTTFTHSQQLTSAFVHLVYRIDLGLTDSHNWEGSYMAETGLDRGRANSASLHLAHVQVTDCSTATDTHAAGAQDGSQSALTAAEWAQMDPTQHTTHQD